MKDFKYFAYYFKLYCIYNRVKNKVQAVQNQRQNKLEGNVPTHTAIKITLVHLYN